MKQSTKAMEREPAQSPFDFLTRLRITHYALRITSYVLLLSSLFASFAFAHQRLVPHPFEGDLRLTGAPRVGNDATLILSIRSNLPEATQAQIWFRLPDGLTPRSPDRFDRIYLPPYAPHQQYVLRLHVDQPGNYPLQASVYATLANGGTVIRHFYTYLLATQSESQTGSDPFDEQIDHPLFLETRVQFHAFPETPGAVTVRGTVVYFDDNERMELPITRPQVLLYLETSADEDIKVASTFADVRGEYTFESLTNPELHGDRPRNLYVMVRFDNPVLSITDGRRRLYERRSETVRDLPDGETTVDLALHSLDAGRGLGHIFNTIQRAHGFLLTQVGWERDRPVQVIWPGTGTVSYYFPHEFAGQVSNETITIAQGEDQWRRITMYHEYGHAVMTAAYGYDYSTVPRGTYQGAHRLETVSDSGFAFNEGWSEFMEAAVDNRALNVTGRLDQEVPNIETNAWWTGGVDGSGPNINGERVEGTVASILWDIFDTAESIDHQRGVDDDRIANRLDLFWEVFTDERPQSITDVAVAWRLKGFPMLEELEQIYATHHTLSRPNAPPIFHFTWPPADGALADTSLQIVWEAIDPDGDAFTIDLFYDEDRRPGGSTLIQSGIAAPLSRFNWNTSGTPEGRYYLRARVTDSRNAETDVYSDGLVFVDHSPLLPPIITSHTHPDADRWYVNDAPQLKLLTEPEQIDGRQYSFVLDGEPETVPDTISDARVRNNALTLSGLSNGLWWVHIRARDGLGYWTDTSHFAIRIDGTPPPTISQVNWTTGEGAEIALEWESVEDISGITAYHVQIDVDSRDFQSDLLVEDTVAGDALRYTFASEPGKTYYARLKAQNGANLLSPNWSAITPGTMIREPQTWDVNHDGIVNITDLVRVASHLGQIVEAPIDPNPDVNRDSVVDISDLIMVAAHFGEDVNAAPGIRGWENPGFTQYPIQNVQFPSYAVPETRLLPNYPNPFNPETWMPYELASPADVKIEIYTANGQLVRHLNFGRQPAGRYHRRNRAAYWDGRDHAGQPVASGIYFYVLHAGTRAYPGKMALSK